MRGSEIEYTRVATAPCSSGSRSRSRTASAVLISVAEAVWAERVMIPAIVARPASRGLVAAAPAAIAVVVALASCGTPAKEGEAGVGFGGCGPESVARHLGGFLNAVSARRDERVLRYIAPRGEFVVFTLDDGVTPGGGRVDSRSPGQLHDSFVAAIPEDRVASFLAVEVGHPGPLVAEYEMRAGSRQTATVQVAVRIGEDRYLAGEFGVECENGRIYAGATSLRRHLEAGRACGRAIGAGAEPAFCRRD